MPSRKPPEEPAVSDVVIEAVKASDSNTELILDRINASDRHTNEVIVAHEKRDQDRFASQTQALNEHKETLGSALADLTHEVKVTNGGLMDVKSKVEIVEDRAGVIAAARGRRLQLGQGIRIAIAGAVATGVVAVVVYLLGG